MLFFVPERSFSVDDERRYQHQGETMTTPQSPYGPPPQMPYGPPPKQKRKIPKWAWIVGAVVIIVIVAAAAGASGSKKKTDATVTPKPVAAATSAPAVKSAAPAAHPTTVQPTTVAPTVSAPAHAEDITITSCAADPTTGYLAAGVTVKNNSSKTSNYLATIAFESKDGATQLDTGLVAVNNLGPGQVSNQTAGGLNVAPPAGYNCKLADLTRYAS
jgi:hypothetical protein